MNGIYNGFILLHLIFLMDLVLASKSYDRKLILDRACIPVTVIPSDFDESSVSLDDPEARLQVTALEKAKIVKKIWLDLNKSPSLEAIIIAADTMGLFNGELIGKPIDKANAFQIIQKLAGNFHDVITAVVLLHTHSETEEIFLVKSRVHFQPLSTDEIHTYLNFNDEYKDRAAAYSIQDRASLFIDSIEGSYSNVIGLPLAELRDHLKKFQINLLKGNI